MAWELGKPEECSNKIFLVLMFSSCSLCCCFPHAEEVQEEGMWNSFSASTFSRSSAWCRCAPRFCNMVEENKRQEKDGSAGRGLPRSFAHVALRVPLTYLCTHLHYGFGEGAAGEMQILSPHPSHSRHPGWFLALGVSDTCHGVTGAWL